MNKADDEKNDAKAIAKIRKEGRRRLNRWINTVMKKYKEECIEKFFTKV